MRNFSVRAASRVLYSVIANFLTALILIAGPISAQADSFLGVAGLTAVATLKSILHSRKSLRRATPARFRASRRKVQQFNLPLPSPA